MKITNLKKLMLLSIALITVLPSNAMWAQRFAKGMRAVHWGVLCPPPVAYSLYKNWLNKEVQKEVQKSSFPKIDDVGQFARSTLKEQGYPPSFVDSIEIRGNYIFESWSNGMFLPIDSSMLEKARFLNSNDDATWNNENQDDDGLQVMNNYEKMWGPIDHTTLDLWKGTICHEAAHIQNQDLLKEQAFLLAAPVLSHLIMKAPASLMKKYIIDNLLKNRFQNFLSVVRGVGSIPSALIKLGGAALMYLRYNKYQENMADEEVRKRVQAPKVLYAQVEIFRRFHEKTQEGLSSEGKLELFERYPLLYETAAPFHPYHLTRAQRFEQAAKRLEDKLAENEQLD